MAQVHDLYRSIYYNLSDSGCDGQTTELCMSYMKEENFSDMLPILMQHKARLLASVRTGHKQIDCLDFRLVFQKEWVP